MAVKKDPRLAVPIQGSLGAHLRKAREEANMTVDKVATALLLRPDAVEALEADAYDRLPAPTFVRGYLRGYARVLSLPSRPILEMYDRQGFEPPPLSPDVSESQQAHTSDTAVKLVTYAVAAVLVVLVGLWWHSQEGGGLGISGDLFDRSPESDRDPLLPADEGTGTAAVGVEADSESIAMAPDGRHALRQGDEPIATPPGADPASGEEADDASVATGAIEPGETSPNGESAGAALAADTASGDLASADTVPVDAPPADAEASGVTAVAAPSEPSRNEEPAVTAPAEESAPGRMDTVLPAPVGAADSGVSEAGEPAATSDPSGDPGADTRADANADAPPDADPEADATAGADRSAEAETGDTDDEETGVPTGTAGADTAGVSPATSPAAISAPNSTEASGDGDATGPDTARTGLVLEFVHESWVEVYDRERTRLFFGLVQPGRVLSFDGSRPFDVLLGFGKDVRVAIDGQAFDHTPYLRHGVARFSVGTRAGVDPGGEASAATEEPAAATATDTGGEESAAATATDTGGEESAAAAATDTTVSRVPSIGPVDP